MANSWLQNLASGKDQYGNQASAGNVAWAKAEIAKSNNSPAPAPAPAKPTSTPTQTGTSGNTGSTSSGNKTNGQTNTGSTGSGSSKNPAPAPVVAPITPAKAPVVTPIKSTPTSYKDSTGASQTGYIIDGKTYKDQQGTQRIDDGSIVTVGGTSYKMTNGAGVPVVNQTPTTPVKAPTNATPTNVTATEYKDSTGANQKGYIINGKTYKDPQGTQRIDDGSVVSVNGVSYKMVNGAGVPVTTQTPAPANTSTIVYKDSTGAEQTGYIIGNKTYKDPQGTQRIDTGSVVTSGGKVFMMTSTGQGIDITNPVLSEVYNYDPETGTVERTNKTLYNVNGTSYDGQGNVYRDVAGDNELIKAQNGTYYNAKTGEEVSISETPEVPIVSQDPAIQQLFDMIYGIASKEIAMDPTLSWEQAWARANQSLGPQYSSAMQSAMEGLDKNALQSGFFGQLPTEALKRNTMGSLEVDKLQAVNQLASQLFGQSEESAYNKLNAASSQKQNEISNMLNLLGIYQNERGYNDSRSDKEWSKNFDLAQLLGSYNGTPTLNYLEYQKPSSSGSGSGSGSSTTAEGEAKNVFSKDEVLDRISNITTVTTNKDGTTTESPDGLGIWKSLTSMYNDGLINKTSYDNYVKGYAKGSVPTQDGVNDMLDRWFKSNSATNFEQRVRNALSEGLLTKDQYADWSK